MKSNVLKPNRSTSWFSHSLSSLAVCGTHGTTQGQPQRVKERTIRTRRDLAVLPTSTHTQKTERTYLEDVQDLVRFLLGDDGVVVETAELPLEPEGVDVAGMQVLLLGRHHVTRDTELKHEICWFKDERVMNSGGAAACLAGQRTAERSYVGREGAAHVGLFPFAVLLRVLVTHLPELVLIPFLRRSLLK